MESDMPSDLDLNILPEGRPNPTVKEEDMDFDGNEEEAVEGIHQVAEDDLKVKMDSCLLCGFSPAVLYDCDGTPIRKLPTQLEYSYQHLFLKLCHLLGIRINSKILRSWNFEAEPFPFCDKCESLLVSLAELYSKLEKLEGVVKENINEAEGKFLEEELYETHDRRYYEFRQQVLEEQRKIERKKRLVEKLSPRKRKKVVKNNKSKRRKLLSIKSDKGRSPSTLSQPEIITSIIVPPVPEDRHTFITKLVEPSTSAAAKSSIFENNLEMKYTEDVPVGRKLRESTIRRSTLIKSQCQKSMSSDDERSSSSPTPSENPSSSDDSDSEPHRPPSRQKSKRKITRIEQGIAKRWGNKPFVTPRLEQERLEVKEDALRRQKQAFDTKFEILKELAKKRKSEMTKAERTRYSSYPILRDPYTNEITLFTGFGNGHMFKRVVLKFIPLPPENEEDNNDKTSDEKEEKVYHYRCDSCSEIVVQKSASTPRQLQTFRAHHKSHHMNKVCKLCPPNSISFTTRSQYLNHLKLVHKIPYTYTMKSAKAPKPAKIDQSIIDSEMMMNKAVSTVPTQFPQRSCWVCGMPFTKLHSAEFRVHLKSHMSEEGKKNFVTTGRRSTPILGADEPIQIAGSRNGTLCQTCGQLVCGGKGGMKQHYQIHHAPPEEKYLCSICGVTLNTSSSLSAHMVRRHPNGKTVDGRTCQFPSCSSESDFVSEESLQHHVSEEHSNSEEDRRGRMCHLCGKVFTTSWSRKLHVNIHTGEGCEECHICHKNFSSKHSLKMHLAAVHREGDGLGSFQCEVEGCGQVFPCRTYLSGHLRKYHGIFKGRGKKCGD